MYQSSRILTATKLRRKVAGCEDYFVLGANYSKILISCCVFMQHYKGRLPGEGGREQICPILEGNTHMVVYLGFHPHKESNCHTACSTLPLQHSMAPSMNNLQNQISASLQKVSKCHLHSS